MQSPAFSFRLQPLSVQIEDKSIVDISTIDEAFQGKLNDDRWQEFSFEYNNYFDTLVDATLVSKFSKDLQLLWLRSLKTEMQSICLSPRRALRQAQADFPWPHDMNFLPFSFFQYLLFAYNFICSPLDFFSFRDIRERIRQSISVGNNSIILWRLNYFFVSDHYDISRPLSRNGSRPPSPGFDTSTPFSILRSRQLEDLLKVDVLSKLSEFKKRDLCFPIVCCEPLSEDIMKFLRVLYWLCHRIRDMPEIGENVVVDLLLLSCSPESIMRVLSNIVKFSFLDKLIVSYENLQGETILKQKRKILNADEGDAFVVKLPKRLSFEEEADDVLYWTSVWNDRQKKVVRKILDIKNDLSNIKGMSSSRSSALCLRLKKKQESLTLINKKLQEMKVWKELVIAKYS